MQVRIEEYPRTLFSDFVDENKLVVEVKERALPVGDLKRYHASIRNIEVRVGICLTFYHGNGPTPGAAIRDYYEKLNLQPIVIDSLKPSRRELEPVRFI